ncbi:hypothetical protein [Curtobacterium sp. MCBD17_008]|uniref:hypothetical protein n=1 Tax=Curtobacterium sp. MCBD17_008 TaxID=2175656 RepID=UPI000DA7E7D4|nr:hypothetical protein [Curtobacterium sp. MCBD17_008]PZE95171.1 hypothetical protein DEI95_02025 [Curtobacterium sp. MCBD17_008]
MSALIDAGSIFAPAAIYPDDMVASRDNSAISCPRRAAFPAVVVLAGAIFAVGMFSLGKIRYSYVSWESVAVASEVAIPLGVVVAAAVARVGVIVRNRAEDELVAHPVRRASVVVGVLAFVAAVVGGLLLTAGGWQLVLPAAAACGCLAAGCSGLLLRQPKADTRDDESDRHGAAHGR